MNNSGEVQTVCEDFMGFVEVKKMDAQSIAGTLLTTVQNWGLDMSCLVAQGYDGASVMSSSKNGVQAKVKEVCPNATYVHCRSHVLNLAVSSGCQSVPSIRNLFDSVEKLTWFLSGSAKRKATFLEVASCESGEQQLLELLTEDDIASESARAIKEGGRKNTTPKFCATRWTARISTLRS